MNVRNGIENLTQIFPSQAGGTASTAQIKNSQQSDGLGNDKAQLSLVATQAAQSASASDVRLDKVANIQGALLAGTYSVAAADVAQKVLHSMLATEK